MHPSDTASTAKDDRAASIIPSEPHIESASASTAQQDSTRFAYALTLGVLVIVSLFVIALALLMYTVAARAAQEGDQRSWLQEYREAPLVSDGEPSRTIDLDLEGTLENVAVIG